MPEAKHTSLRVERSSHRGGKYRQIGAALDNKSLLGGKTKTFNDNRVLPMNIQAGIAFHAIMLCLVAQFVLGIIALLEEVDAVSVKPLNWFIVLTVISGIITIANASQFGLIRAEAARRKVSITSIVFNEPIFAWCAFIGFIIFVIDHIAIFNWDYTRSNPDILSSPNNSQGLSIQGVLNLFLYLNIIVAFLAIVVMFILTSLNRKALST